MISILIWKDVKKELPDVNTKCLCFTSNGKYILSEMYYPKDSNGKQINDTKEWKGSSKTTDSIIKWAYLNIEIMPNNEHFFEYSITNEELINLLLQYPKDAIVVIEYCNPRLLTYCNKTNIIKID